jgi:hypothetical protein
VADVLGVGLTHYPLLAGADTHMAALLKSALKDPDIPEEFKDRSRWSELAQQEWGDDGGVSAAAAHRARLLEDMRTCRQAIDEFEPDVLLVWGDDQYENFREEVIPSFCVLAYQDTVVEPFGVLDMLKVPNVWGLPSDTTFTMKGDPEFAKQLTSDVLNDGIDVAYSYEPRQGIHFPHAFGNTQLFLDYDNVGKEFPYPIVPLAVNCYGEHVIARRGGLARFAEINKGEQLDPPGPSPRRCFQLGHRCYSDFPPTHDRCLTPSRPLRDPRRPKPKPSSTPMPCRLFPLLPSLLLPGPGPMAEAPRSAAATSCTTE